MAGSFGQKLTFFYALYPFLYRAEHFKNFEGKKRAKRCREKRRTRGGQQRGQKGKKDARKQVSLCLTNLCQVKAMFP